MAAALDIASITRTRSGALLGISQHLPSDEELAALAERLEVVEILCNEQSYEDALDLASRCLQIAETMYGSDDLRLAVPYILVGRATAGLGRLKKAEKILSLANYVVLKNNAAADMKSKLFRAVGGLYYLKRKDGRDYRQEALRVYSDDVFHASTAFGPEDYRTAGGYCGLAAVFQSGGQLDSANVMYTKVVNVWHKALLDWWKSRQGESEAGPETELNSVEKSEAQFQLLESMQFFADPSSTDTIQEGVCCASLGILCSFNAEQAELSKQFLERALALLPAEGDLHSVLIKQMGT
jgi:tetratricopeptide (TPR) repeat protein